MECKFVRPSTAFALSLIKIETYWNVNRFICLGNNPASLIKIETYWNVNTKTSELENDANFIKIETYWNVNLNSAVML